MSSDTDVFACRQTAATPIRLSLCQVASCPGNVEANIHSIETYARKYCVVSDLVVFPELFLTGYAIGKKRMLAVSMQKTDDTLKRVAALAKDLGCAIAVSFPERPDLRSSAMFIAVVVFDGAGEEACFYRKRHLWGTYERGMFLPGEDDPVPFSLPHVPHVKLGFAICYDLQFSDVTNVHTRHGVQVLVFVSACSARDMTKIRLVAAHLALHHEMTVCYVNHPSGRSEPETMGDTPCTLDGAAVYGCTEGFGSVPRKRDVVCFSGGSFVFSTKGQLLYHAGILSEIIRQTVRV